MQVMERDVPALKEAHRKSAERVRTLLEELEIAEREFATLTDKLRAFRESPAPREGAPSSLNPKKWPESQTKGGTSHSERGSTH